MGVLTRVRLWQAKCRPILEYASEIWHGEISATWVKKLERVQTSFCMAALNLSGSPAAVALRAELGLLPLVARRDLSKLRCWNKWCLASDDLLLKKIFVGRHAEVLVGGASLSNLNTMLPILTKFGFLAQWVGCNSNLDDGYDWMEKCRFVCLQLYRHKEKVEMVSRPTLSFYHSLDLYRPGLSTFLMDTSNPQGVRLTC